MIDESTPTLHVIASGTRRPGLTDALLQAIAELDVDIVDLAESYVRDHLMISLLVASPTTHLSEVADRLGLAASDHGLNVTIHFGRGDNAPRPRSRVSVMVMAPRLTAHELAPVTGNIVALGGTIDRIHRLSRTPVTTLELSVSGADIEALRTRLTSIAANSWVDIAIAPGGLARRGRRLVVMDVDSTLIQQEVIELLARRAGREAEVAAVTERAMRGELDFADSLRERVATLAGLPDTVFPDVVEEVRLTPGARTLVRTLHSIGYSVGLVSGGFAEIVQPIADRLGITHVAANRLEVAEGRLTGRVLGTIVDRAEKARALRRFADEEGLPLSRTVAIGDGANDLDMLATAGFGVAFNAKPVVRAHAHTAVNVPYLDSVLYLLGINRDDLDLDE